MNYRILFLISMVLMLFALLLRKNENVSAATGRHFPSEVIQVDGIDSVVRFVDTDYNVVCYSASRYSVSCAPINKGK